jgi:hypothetical protein
VLSPVTSKPANGPNDNKRFWTDCDGFLPMEAIQEFLTGAGGRHFVFHFVLQKWIKSYNLILFRRFANVPRGQTLDGLLAWRMLNSHWRFPKSNM